MSVMPAERASYAVFLAADSDAKPQLSADGKKDLDES
jgi:hypothetical protein